MLELHLYSGSDHYLGGCLVGAYQESLSDTNAVHVSLADDGQMVIDEGIEGDTVDEVLQYVQYSLDQLMRSMRKRVERALREKHLTLEQSRLLLRFCESGLKGYTYLE